MKTQVVQDHNGKATGVFIPIKEWNELKSKYPGIEHTISTIPEWHKDEVRKRIKESKSQVDAIKMIDELEAE